MGYRTLLVGTDGSITATTARDAAIRLAKRLRARLVVVCAWGPPLLTRPMAESLVGYALEAATRAGVEADAEMATQDPADLLLEVAQRRQADLLLVGNKGMGEAKRFRLGSVPDRIAHFAPCDLLIVDTARFQTAQGRSDRLYKGIVAGTDGSPTAAEAARKAFELAMLVRAEVTLVYVGDPIVGAITLEETASGRPEGVTGHTQVTEGEPSARVIGRAEATDRGSTWRDRSSGRQPPSRSRSSRWARDWTRSPASGGEGVPRGRGWIGSSSWGRALRAEPRPRSCGGRVSTAHSS